MGTGQVTDLKCHGEANVVTDWIRKNEAQASGLATGQILTQGMGLRKKRGLQGAVQVRTQVQLCNTELGETVAFVSRRLL